MDIPPLMSEIREQTYQSYARPKALGPALLGPTRGRAWLATVVVAATVVVGLLILGWDRLVAPPAEEEAFYEVIPFLVMTHALDRPSPSMNSRCATLARSNSSRQPWP